MRRPAMPDTGATPRRSPPSLRRIAIALAACALLAVVAMQALESARERLSSPRSFAFCAGVQAGAVSEAIRSRARDAGAEVAQLSTGVLLVRFPHELLCQVRLEGGKAASADVVRRD